MVTPPSRVADQRKRGRRDVRRLEGHQPVRCAAGARARLDQPVQQRLGAQRNEPQRIAAARQRRRRARGALVGEDGDAAQPGGPQHGLAQVVLVDHVAARRGLRLQDPDLVAVLELEQGVGVGAVEDEDLAILGDVAGHGRGGELPALGRPGTEQALAQALRPRGGRSAESQDACADRGREDRPR
jgi:hypothetical protein